MTKSFITYGLALALLALIMQILDYNFAIRSLSSEWYIILLALLFTGMGVWAGNRLTSRKAEPEEFEINQKAIDYLEISERELEVLDLLAKGHSNKEIADKLFVSINTIKTHLAHLYQKLDVSRRGQAVEKAKSLKILP